MISHWLGWLSFGFCIVLMLKFVIRKTKISTLNLCFRKLHIPFGIMLLIAGMLHGVVAIAKTSNRIAPVVTGIVAMICILLITATYIFRRKIKKKWMHFHRIGILLLIPFILTHLLMSLK